MCVLEMYRYLIRQMRPMGFRFAKRRRRVLLLADEKTDCFLTSTSSYSQCCKFKSILNQITRLIPNSSFLFNKQNFSTSCLNNLNKEKNIMPKYEYPKVKRDEAIVDTYHGVEVGLFTIPN